MSWTYDRPDDHQVISDGVTVKTYDPQNQQMYQTAVAKSQYPAALVFLMGNGSLTRDFTLRLLDAAQLRFAGGYVLECTPNVAIPAYRKVVLYVDGPTKQVGRVLILDAQGNRSRFDFDAPTMNQPVDPDELNFTPPLGTKVIKQ